MSVKTVSIASSCIAIVITAILGGIYYNKADDVVVQKEELPPFVMHINSTVSFIDSTNGRLIRIYHRKRTTILGQILSVRFSVTYRQIEIPETCRIVHTATIQRHGARHLNKLKKLDKAAKAFEDLRTI